MLSIIEVLCSPLQRIWFLGFTLFCGSLQAQPKGIQITTSTTSIPSKCQHLLSLATMRIPATFAMAIDGHQQSRDWILKVLQTPAGREFFSQRLDVLSDQSRFSQIVTRLFETHPMQQAREAASDISKNPDLGLNELLSALSETGEGEQFLKIVDQIRIRFVKESSASLENPDSLLQKIASEEIRYIKPKFSTRFTHMGFLPPKPWALRTNAQPHEFKTQDLSTLIFMSTTSPDGVVPDTEKVRVRYTSSQREFGLINSENGPSTKISFDNGSHILIPKKHAVEISYPSRNRDPIFSPSARYQFFSQDGKIETIDLVMDAETKEVIQTQFLGSAQSERGAFFVWMDKQIEYQPHPHYRLWIFGLNDRGEKSLIPISIPISTGGYSVSLFDRAEGQHHLMVPVFYRDTTLHSVSPMEWELRRGESVIAKIQIDSDTGLFRFVRHEF